MLEINLSDQPTILIETSKKQQERSAFMESASMLLMFNKGQANKYEPILQLLKKGLNKVLD